MAEQDIFSLLGDDEGKISSDMNDLNPTLGVTPDMQQQQQATSSATPTATTVVTASQPDPPKQQQQVVNVTPRHNVLTGSDPMLSQGLGRAVASQLTSVQVKQMNTPSNPMWGSARPTSTPQTIVLQHGKAGGQPAKLMSHHDYAISTQKPTLKVGQQLQIQKQQQTVQAQLQQQQQNVIQQQLQLSQQHQQQIKQQLQQLQQKQIQLQQQSQQKQAATQGGFQQLQGGQTITLSGGLQQKIGPQSPGKITLGQPVGQTVTLTGLQQSPGRIVGQQGGQTITISGLQQKVLQQSPNKLTIGGTAQQPTIIRLPASLAQQVQQQSLHITPSSSVQTVTLGQPKLAAATTTPAAATATPRFIITRQPTQAQQAGGASQPVQFQLQMQDVNSLQKNIGKLQTLPGGQVIRLQPAQQQQPGAVQTVLQQQPRFTLTNNAGGAKVATIQQGTQQQQRVITLTPQQAQQLLQRSGGQGLTFVSQGASTATTTTSSTGPVLRTVVIPQQTSTAGSVGQVLRTLVVSKQSGTTPQAAITTTAGLATQNLNLLASQAAGANTAAAQQLLLQQIVGSSSGQVISKPRVVVSQGQVSQARPGLVATQAQVTARPGLVATQTQVTARPGLVGTQSRVVAKPGMTVTQVPGSIAQQVMKTVTVSQAVNTSQTAPPLAPITSQAKTIGLTSLQASSLGLTLPTMTTPTMTTTAGTPQVVSASAISSPIKTTGVASASMAQLAKQLMSNSSAAPASSATHTITTNASGQQVLSTIMPQKPIVQAASNTAPLQIVRTPAPQQATTATGVTGAKPPGGKITISAATAQMLAQKGIVLTRTPQGTFVAKIPQSMLAKAAAGQAGGKPGILNLLTKPQGAAAVAQSTIAGTPPQPTIVKTQAKAKSQPTILSKAKSKKVAKTQPAAGTMIVSSASTSSSAMPKLMFTIGGQQVQTVPTSMSAVEQKPKVVVSMKPFGGISAADEVKKIGEELGKLQGQSKTPENLQKLKDLHSKLKQLQLTVQASAVVAKSRSPDASTSAKSSEDTDGDSKSPKDDKERRKLMKQRQLQDKANRIVAEAVAKAKASGLKDIPKIMINVSLPEVTDDEVAKPKKEKSKRPKSSKPKSSRPKPVKTPKPPKPVKEKKIHVPSKNKKSKKLPLAALNKLKKQRKKLLNLSGNESESSEYDETPPRSPESELKSLYEKRRSSRNTNKQKKYTEEYDFNITDSSSSSSSDDNDNKPPKVKKEKRPKKERTTVISKESEDGDTNVEIDVETVEPSMLAGGEQAKFFVDNPDESQANVVEKILARRTVKKPQLPGEAQVGEMEEFFVKYRSYSYLHCEWCTQEKLLKGDIRIPQKIRRFRAKHHFSSLQALQDMEDEPFNPDYIEVERVIDKTITEDPDNPGQMVTHYLIKWCGLPYEDATWENPDDVNQEKAKLHQKYSKIPSSSERKRVSKPPLPDWKKMDKTKEYVNENVLREYQLEGVNWLTFSWYNGQNCILADEMGLGKTIQAITFLEEVRAKGIRGPFLVIAPLSTIANWQREFEAWTDVNVVVYHGSSQSRHMIAEYEMYYKNDKGLILPNIYKFHVLITTYEIVLADCQELSEIEWRVCVIDEAHRLKNRNCKLIEGLKILDLEHRVLLTGTPLQNNVEELFSLLNFLDPLSFRSSTQFMEKFGNMESESQVEKLQQILRPMMLRRLKEDVEKNLAPKEETIIEVELTNIQKKYYRAILERNFNFLNKGTTSNANLPNLMNTMMELRKCCNHPFLIKGAEDQIMLEFEDLPEDEMPYRHLKALVQSAGKMVLLDKLLPKLKEGGHKVLIFSQMIRCLDILEDYLMQKQYPFERIDGRVRGNMRQAAIDRFSKPDSDRFVFLLCTRAGGLGINLTAADTCVIFDSDWNPQNDLQAQARCHRIGQKKSVKIYRLITRNSYEREMFDKASLKLGLDKAVLQSMRNTGENKDAPNAVQPMSKTEIEDLLKRGAYGAIMDDDEDLASRFCEEDIDVILQRRTQIVKIEAGVKGSTFAKASFSLSGDKHASEIKLDDPDFWEKWAKRAELDVDQLKNRENMVIDLPRQRKQTKRYGNMDMVELDSSSSDQDEANDPPKTATTTTTTKSQKKQPNLVPEKPSKKQLQSGWTRLECFRVEKGLLTYGWGRWNDIISTTRFKRRLGEKDTEAISRTMLIYCLLHYKGDENIKSFIWDLVTPSADGTVKDYKNHKGLSAPVPRGRKGRKPKKEEPVVPAILEYDFNNKDQDPETLLTDQGYKNHLKRHCNKVLLRVRLLYYLKQEVIGDAVEQIEQGASVSDIKIAIPNPEGEPPISWWDEEADRSLMIGVFKHGYERYIAMRNDPTLCFLERCGPPNQQDIARENNDEFNDSQLDVEGTDGMDMKDDLDDMKPSMKDELMDCLDANEKEESLSSFPPSRTGSPAPRTESPALNKPKAADAVVPIPCQPGKLPFPPAPDLNTRLRRLVATFQRNHKREQMKVAKRERREHVKKIRFEEQARQRELRKLEHAQKLQEQHRQKELRKLELAQKWSRREEADFYRILAAYGVEMNAETSKYEWTNFKKLAKLERKYDEKMSEYYEHFRVMCLKVCKKDALIPEDWDKRPPPEFNIEGISEERANKCLHRIDLLLKIRNEVLPHPDRDRRLKRCRRSMELPEWWEPGKHDKDLIIGTARYGVNRMESQLQMMNDPDLTFQELKERYPKWHLPASAFFPPAPPKPAKKPEVKTEMGEDNKPSEGASTSSPSTSAQPESGVKQEYIDPDTGEERTSAVGGEIKQEPDCDVKKEPEDAERMNDSRVKKEPDDEDAERMDDSQCSSQSSPGGELAADKFSQESGNLENESSQLNSLGSSQQKLNSQDNESLLNSSESYPNHLASSQEPLGSSLDVKHEDKEKSDVNATNVTSNCDGDDRTTSGPSSVDGLAQRELCRPPDDGMSGLDENKEDLKTGALGSSSAYLNPSEFMRWPKDRVIVHRLEQISHCVIKGEWPGRRRHHHNDPSRSQGGAHSGEGRGDGVVTPAEHNYAGDDGREVTKTILPKKKKRRKRAEIEQERAAQLAVLLGQNPSLGLHPVFSSLMTSLPLAGAQMPQSLAAAAMSPLDLSQNPTSATGGGATSRYHIEDAAFPAGEAGLHQQQALLAAQLAAGMHPGMQSLIHKKKKKHKKVDGAGPMMDPEERERRRRRKLELLEKKRRRKRKQKDKAKEMSDAFNALKDDDHVPVMNPRTGERYVGAAAPMKKQLGAWMKEHPGFELLYPFHAVVSPDGTSVSFPPLPKSSHDDSQSDEPPKKKKKKSQRNPAKLDPTKLTGEEHVDMIDRVTGKRLPNKLTPTLNNLAEWLVRNPAYDVVSEWGSIVKAKGYISEDQFNRVSHRSMKPVATPARRSPVSASAGVAAVGVNPAAQAAAAIMASGQAQSKLSMQIGQGSLGGLGRLSSFPGLPIMPQQGQLGNDAMAIAAAAQQLVNMQMTSPQPIKKSLTKKKKLKTSHPPVTLNKPVVTTPLASAPPPVSGVPSLAGISPYLLPTQGGVFYSPFLASHNVQGLIAGTTTAASGTATSSTNSLDNESQSSSVDSNLRTETREEENSLDAMHVGNFADDDDGTFAGVDLGDLDGELGEDVINEIAMEEDDME